jgi:hypothetical protein
MYKKTVKLQHNETVAIVNKETGEVKEVKGKPGNPGFKYNNKELTFKKAFELGFEYVNIHFSNEEKGVILTMIGMAKPYSNSMPPLNDEVSKRKLADYFNLDRRRLDKILLKLKKHGIYYSYDITEFGTEENKYWILNPDLAFNGKIIPIGIKEQFKATLLSIYVNGKQYGKS